MRHFTTTLFQCAVCVGTVLVSVNAALGGDGSSGRVSPDASNSWTLNAMPYGWLPFLKGDQTLRGRTASIDVNPIQVLEHLDAAPWMSYVEARKGPLAIYNDIFYAKLGIAASRARSFDGSTLNVSATVEFEQAVVEAGAAYEIARWRSGGGMKDGAPARFTAVDLVVGARYWHQDMALNLALGAFDTTGLELSGGRAIARGGSVDWVDPLVGFRIRHQLAPGRDLVLRADVGGFDVGSKFSWNLLGAYSWDIAVHGGVTYSGVMGYRALSVDYSKGAGLDKYEYDVLQHGPIVGLSAKF